MDEEQTMTSIDRKPEGTTLSRRDMMRQGAAAIAGGALAMGARPELVQATPAELETPALPPPLPDARRMPPGRPGVDYTPVVTPNGTTLPFRLVNGVKVFHLTAGAFTHDFALGLRVTCWGYNGRTPGPTIEAVEGDRVRIYVTNKLPEPTSVHWHGVLLPAGMDGVAGLSQAPIPVNATFKYEFTLRQHGTLMYHAHYDEMVQQGLGLMGMFVIHPRHPVARPDRDFVLLSSEWKVPIGAARPDPNEMTDFNILTFNGKAFPATEPLQMQIGERVRIRFGNLSAMSHHPIHVHGLRWPVVATDGGDIAVAGQWPETTVLVPV